MTESPISSIVLPIKLTNANDGRGGSFWESAKRRKDYESIIAACGVRHTPFYSVVTIRITRILGPRERLWDADSVLRGSAKELIDAMVACGWFVDDGPKWIKTCDGRQDKSQRENGPSVLLEVFADGG